MKHLLLLGLLLALLIPSACAATREEAEERTRDAQPGAAQPDANSLDTDEADQGYVTAGEVVERMIIYSAQLSLSVDMPRETQSNVIELVNRLGGYVNSSESYTTGDDLLNINMTVRVPAERFDEAMATLREMGREVTHESIQSEDVTQEYVDLESRLRALEVKEARLETLMDEAEDTEAVLEVYRELSQTQQEIEQTKGRMQYLSQLSAMATITLHLAQDELAQPVEVAGWRFGGTLRRAFDALMDAIQFLIQGLIWFLVLVFPILLVIGSLLFALVKLLGWMLRRRAHRRRARVAQEIEPPAAT